MNSPLHPYSSWLRNVFERSAATYSQVGPDWFGYFGQFLVDQAGVSEGEVVLDLACGRGSSLIPARDRLGLTGRVVGVDFAAEMLKNLKRTHGEASGANLVQMDAMQLGFGEGAFDLVLCGLALFFMPDLSKALHQVRRVLKPGGRFVASTFGDRDVRWAPLGEIAKDFESQLSPSPQANIPALNTAEELTATLESAGFEALEVVSITREFHFANELEWWQTMWSHGGRGYLQRMAPEVLTEFQNQVFKYLKTLKGESGIPDRFEVLVSRSQKPLM